MFLILGEANMRFKRAYETVGFTVKHYTLVLYV